MTSINGGISMGFFGEKNLGFGMMRMPKNEDGSFDEKWTILDKGDAIHLKVKIAAFPAKKQIAVDKVREAILNF